MKTDEIRSRFLDFFKARGHTLVASDLLVPQNDPSLLFTGAGMNQFKEYFLGLKKDLKRAASSQKCLRTGDLDQVGRTPYHHSFFEMLGNFSFGDYFKEEAIRWAWEFLTEELRLPPERLRVSVHLEDKEAYQIWKDPIGVRSHWIYKMGDKTNFWPANAPKEGPNGPCGPCSEIYYDQNPSAGTGSSVEGDPNRFAEIWNLVFTQYDRKEGGELVPLAAKNIDTGMGLERLACVMQGKVTNFEIDIFQKVNFEVEKCLGLERRPEILKTDFGNFTYFNNLNAISDHARAVIFALTDGVIPSNEGRGYVIRKLIRRALWRASVLSGLLGKKRDRPFLYQLIPIIGTVMEGAYPEVMEASQSIRGTLQGEEERFLSTLETGLGILESRLQALKRKEILPGEVVFELYDTYGFPDELTRKIAEDHNLEIDQKGFDRLMEAQRKRAREASQMAGSIFVTTEFEKKLTSLPPTRFLGYQTLESGAKILLSEVREGKGIVVLDQTPFYAESGGQVGDQGGLQGKAFEARVFDTQKKDRYVLHHIDVLKGKPTPGEEVTASVDRSRRDRAMRNHTATHLLHAALRNYLGKQVRQVGSLVAPEKLRFDYSHSKPLTEDQIREIEALVNQEILKDTALSKEERDTEEAKKEGAIAFFGEKYGKRVRVVTIPGFSKEFCGGTHCERTGQIGAFVITSDTSIASAVRRIEALTGEGALSYLQGLRSKLRQASEKLRVSPEELADRVGKLQGRVKQLEKQNQDRTLIQIDPQKLLEEAEQVGEARLVLRQVNILHRRDLRKIHDGLRSSAKKTVWVLFAILEDKVYFLTGLSADWKGDPQDARVVSEKVTSVIGGSGGGRKDLVEGGSNDPKKLDENWETLRQTVFDYVLRG